MIIDFKLQNIFKQIKEELATQGITLSDDVIHDIVDSQFKAVKLGMEQCDRIVLPFFGTFDIKKRTKYVYNQMKENGEQTVLTDKIDNGLRKIKFNAI